VAGSSSTSTGTIGWFPLSVQVGAVGAQVRTGLPVVATATWSTVAKRAAIPLACTATSIDGADDGSWSGEVTAVTRTSPAPGSTSTGMKSWVVTPSAVGGAVQIVSRSSRPEQVQPDTGSGRAARPLRPLGLPRSSAPVRRIAR